MLKSQAKKYGCTIKDAEKYWKEAKKDASKSYDKKDDKYWGTVTKILKNKLKKHCKKNESNILKFNEYSVNENMISDTQMKDILLDREMFSINDLLRFQKEKGYQVLALNEEGVVEELISWKNSWKNWGDAF